jgi:cytochrome c peroxidase
MLWKFKMLFPVLLLLLTIVAARRQGHELGVSNSEKLFRTGSLSFAESTRKLKSAIISLDESLESLHRTKEALSESRLCYKQIESFIEYFFFNSARIYNRAPKNEVEEPYPEYQEPMGLQYIESLLYGDRPLDNRKELIDQINILNASAADLNSLLYQFNAKDPQILESLRIELVRIMTLGITGFDAPLAKTGIRESLEAMAVMQKALQPYLESTGTERDSVVFYLGSTLEYLSKHNDFDSFDRLAFLTSHMLPLQTHLGKLIRQKGLEINTANVLNYDARHLFSPNALNMAAFTPGGSDLNAKQIALGKMLFSDVSLSGNSTMSCASCHSPENYFQDGLDKSFGFAQKKVKRNAPSLLYAGYQHSQFWEGRAKTMEEQIESVTKDTLEMHGTSEIMVSRISEKGSYRRMFRRAFRGKSDISEKNVYRAIASYIRTLNPFNSGFDRYIAGNTSAMNASQIQGFNLFMGKAQCGTCHFAPVFNGLAPPLYKLTEFEVLGTPSNENLSQPLQDTDNGRIEFRNVKYYQGAFKTPGVRNIAKTGPYMHNGAFSSLDSLMEFYNRGGGAGLGFDLPYQTLSANPLNLSEQEKKDIINFLEALTDQ